MTLLIVDFYMMITDLSLSIMTYYFLKKKNKKLPLLTLLNDGEYVYSFGPLVAKFVLFSLFPLKKQKTNSMLYRI